MQGSNIIIKNKELRAKFIAQQEKKGFFTLNTLSFEATRLAYTKGDGWLAEFKNLIHYNYDILVDFIKEKFSISYSISIRRNIFSLARL